MFFCSLKPTVMLTFLFLFFILVSNRPAAAADMQLDHSLAIGECAQTFSGNIPVKVCRDNRGQYRILPTDSDASPSNVNLEEESGGRYTASPPSSDVTGATPLNAHEPLDNPPQEDASSPLDQGPPNDNALSSISTQSSSANSSPATAPNPNTYIPSSPAPAIASPTPQNQPVARVDTRDASVSPLMIFIIFVSILLLILLLKRIISVIHPTFLRGKSPSSSKGDVPPSGDEIRNYLIFRANRRIYIVSILISSVILSLWLSGGFLFLGGLGFLLIVSKSAKINEESFSNHTNFEAAATLISRISSDIVLTKTFKGIRAPQTFLAITETDNTLIITPQDCWMQKGKACLVEKTVNIQARSVSYNIDTADPAANEEIIAETWKFATKVGNRDFRYKKNQGAVPDNQPRSLETHCLN